MWFIQPSNPEQHSIEMGEAEKVADTRTYALKSHSHSTWGGGALQVNRMRNAPLVLPEAN